MTTQSIVVGNRIEIDPDDSITYDFGNGYKIPYPPKVTNTIEVYRDGHILTYEVYGQQVQITSRIADSFDDKLVQEMSEVYERDRKRRLEEYNNG